MKKNQDNKRFREKMACVVEVNANERSGKVKSNVDNLTFPDYYKDKGQ